MKRLRAARYRLTRLTDRWWIANQINRLPGTCWADLVDWALGSQRWPWAPVTRDCRADAAASGCGRCYCGQIGADGKPFRGES